MAIDWGHLSIQLVVAVAGIGGSIIRFGITSYYSDVRNKANVDLFINQTGENVDIKSYATYEVLNDFSIRHE